MLRKFALVLFLLYGTLNIFGSVCVNGVYYELTDSTKTAVVVSPLHGARYSGDTIIVPSIITYKDQVYSVTSISGGSFYASTIKHVIIEEGIRSIGGTAFMSCSQLSDIVLPNSLVSIGSQAFQWCVKLKSIIIPPKVKELSLLLFASCDSLSSIILPDSLLIIRAGALSGCQALKSITLPNLVTILEERAFMACTAITSFVASDSLKTIDGLTFSGCTALKNVILNESLTIIKGESAFGCCTSLDSIYIPNGVTSIGTLTFSGCSALRAVSMGTGLSSIGKQAFYECHALEHFDIDEGNPYLCSIDGVVYNRDTTNLVLYPIGRKITEYSILNGVANLLDMSFQLCTTIQTLFIPNSVSKIGMGTFTGCSSLSTIVCEATIPPQLGSYTFFYSFLGGVHPIDLYVPDASVSLYENANQWKDLTIHPLSEYYSSLKDITDKIDNLHGNKIIYLGHLYIVHDNKYYDVLGR